MSETLTDIYDRLRQRPRPKPGRLAALLLLPALALTGCGMSSGLETSVCGTIADVPIRVEDSVCGRTTSRTATPIQTPSGWVRWYTADRRCLDADDRTRVGDSLDDDYLGERCDPKRSTPLVATTPVPTTSRSSTSPRASTSKASTKARSTSTR